MDLGTILKEADDLYKVNNYVVVKELDDFLADDLVKYCANKNKNLNLRHNISLYADVKATYYEDDIDFGYLPIANRKNCGKKVDELDSEEVDYEFIGNDLLTILNKIEPKSYLAINLLKDDLATKVIDDILVKGTEVIKAKNLHIFII